jgi:hypothetical protein
LHQGDFGFKFADETEMRNFCRIAIVFLMWCVLTEACPQEPVKPERMPHLVSGKIIGNDTIPHVFLAEVLVTTGWKHKNNRDALRYSRLVRNVKITLPYARLASAKLREINQQLLLLPTDKQRKDYLKKAEKELFAEFEAPLRKLTFSQGRLLINLIDRETGDTSFNLIKEYKGGFSAFFWQSIARVFGANLKDEYDPEGDDRMVENIVTLIDNGLL